MSQGTVLYRFRINLSDIERSIYEALDFRLALHASESIPFLLTRMLAYVLNFSSSLAFSAKGLADPDEPCLSSDDPRGGKLLWIEVGNPSPRRLHKAAKAAKFVKVYTYKNPEALLRELENEKIHNSEKIQIFSLNSIFLEEIQSILQRDNEWTIINNEGSLTVNSGDETFQTEIGIYTLVGN